MNHEKHGTRLYLAALKADGAMEDALKPVAIAPDVRGAVWSPAADRLLVFTEAPNDLSDLGPAGGAWVVDAATPDKPTKLDAVPATVGGGAFSTDGTKSFLARQRRKMRRQDTTSCLRLLSEMQRPSRQAVGRF